MSEYTNAKEFCLLMSEGMKCASCEKLAEERLAIWNEGYDCGYAEGFYDASFDEEDDE